jgi:uncharacterized repeat protein (TIGR03803 family)
MIKTIYVSLLTASCCFFLRTGAAGEERRTETTSTYLTSPANESTSVNINSTCVAKLVANATKYTFQFSLPMDFSSDVLTYTSETNSVLITGLKYSTTYYARVKSNLTSYGIVTSFTTKSAVDYTFVSKPANGSVGSDAVELKVTANFVTGASRYTIELSTTSDFSDSLLVRTSTQDNQRTLIFHGLKYATRYYARVKTNLSDDYGKVTSFTTRAEQFASVKEPGDDASAQDYSVIKVELVPVYQAKRYVVELSTQPDFSNALRLSSLTDHQYAFVYENLHPSTTYYARATSNVSTAYGPTTKFTTHAASAKRRLWGVTTGGGTAGAGTVFSFSLDSLTFTKHHDNVSTEYLHGSLTQGPSGFLYGMGIQYSTGDGGEVYRLNPQGNYSALYSGGIHFGSLMLASDNHLYVIDDWLNAFRGGIRRLSTDGSDQDVLASIIQKFRSDNDGLNPIAAPIEAGEYLIGMAPHGGLNKKGVIYKRKFDGGFEVIHHFNGTDGASPQGRLTAGADGYLYGMTFAGGVSNQGTVFRIKPDGSNFKKLLDFSGGNGRYPFGDLIQVGNFFYGMTSEGGNADDGIIFKIGGDGSFSKIFDFTGSNGSIPMGNLTLDNGVLYGMTANGGLNDLGVIFKVNTNGSGYAKLYDFTASGGSNPDGSALIIDDTFDNSARIASTVSNQIKPVASFYPNPFSSSMTIEMSSSENENFSVTLTDLSGRVVHQQQGNHAVQIGENLQQGTYIMKIVRGHDVMQQRVVKR